MTGAVIKSPVFVSQKIRSMKQKALLVNRI